VTTECGGRLSGSSRGGHDFADCPQRSDMEYVGRLYSQMEALTPNADAVITKLLDAGRTFRPRQSLAVDRGDGEMASNFEEVVQGMPDLASVFAHAHVPAGPRRGLGGRILKPVGICL
jgi:hypothetical protein